MNHSLKNVLNLFLLFSLCISVQAQTPMLMKDFHVSGDGSPSLYIEDGAYLYFKAYTNNGVQIFRTDGNINSTVPLIAASFLDIEEFEIIGGKAYITMYDNSYDLHLYEHSLLPGTAPTQIIINTSGSSDVTNLVHVNGRLYFNARTTTNGFQICSIDLATNTLFEHIAPAPYNTSSGLFIETNAAYTSTGYKSIIPLNNMLFFNCRFQHQNLLSLDISGSPTFPIALGTTSATSFAPYPFNGKVYMYSDGDLISSDGSSIVVEQADLGPYFFREFQNRLYFSGESSDPATSQGVLYSIDASSTIREFPSIPAFGGTTIFNRQNNNYSLVILDNELHAFTNPYPLSTPVYGVHSIDLTDPNLPTINLALADVPKEMHNIKKINGFYYYWYLPWQTNSQQLKKANATVDIVLASYSLGDSSFKHFKYWQNDLYFTGVLQTSQIASCETFPPGYSVGYEWYKLSESQLDCQSARVADAAFFSKDNIMASQTSITINDPILQNSNSCHILSAPNIYVNNTLQIIPPAVLVTNGDGCQ